MESTRNFVFVYGLDPLFYEIVVAVLSNHGWCARGPMDYFRTPECRELALVFGTANGQSLTEAVRHVHNEVPTAKIVLVGVQPTESELLRFIEEGVSAYLPTSEGLAGFLETLQQVRDNRTSCHGRITQLLFKSIKRLSREQITGCETPLTVREAEILQLIVAGLSNKEIADRLCIASNTVKNHVHHLLTKLQAKSRHELAWFQTRSQGRFLPTETSRSLSLATAPPRIERP
jgi:DNA-binding NarL/FixJ family response regulator